MSKPKVFGGILVILILLVLAILASQNTDTRSPQVEVPEYVLLDAVDLLNGRRYGDVLVATFSASTSMQTRETVLRAIASQERLHDAALYCSKDAMKAQFSGAFAEAHPEASKCYLGALTNGAFRPPLK